MRGIDGDIYVREGLRVPCLSEESMQALRKTVPVAGSIAGNPLDMWRTFEDTDYLLAILELAYNEPNVDMLIVDRLIPRKAFHMQEKEDATAQIAAFIDGDSPESTKFTRQNFRNSWDSPPWEQSLNRRIVPELM